MIGVELVNTIANNLVKLSFYGLIIYFAKKYLGRYIEIKLNHAKDRTHLDLIKAVGLMTNEHIDVITALEKTLKLTNKIEKFEEKRRAKKLESK